MAGKKKGLGRGLDALLGASASKPATDSPQPAASTSDNGLMRELPVEFMQRGKYQPRRDMSPEALEELANSIKAQGVMQPIVVRPVGEQRYEIIAGERRWRASQLAGLDTVPVIIKDVPDEAAIAMALIENIQREDLNPMEEAMALHRLQQEFELTQQEIASAVGKSRSTIANLLRLMSLRDDVRRMLEHGDLEMGHARAILGLPQQLQSMAAKNVVAKSLSVRQTESMVRRLHQEQDQQKNQAKTEPDADIRQLENELSQKLGAPVMVQHGGKGKGRLVIRYSSLDELDGVLAHLRR
ncbi:MAG TPA: ParB/RepB/Spo0J family partition protein [Pseudomonadales bacterium]